MEIILFESEREFASCLTDLLVDSGARVRSVSSYAELLQDIREGKVQLLICDLGDDERTDSFLQELVRLLRPPQKVVFTSIYNDIERWIPLTQYRGTFRFIPKPFRTQEMTGFLLAPDRRHQSEGA